MPPLVHASLETMREKKIRIFGVPMDLGQQRRGVDMGPSAMRYAGLQSELRQLGYQVVDEGNIEVRAPEQEGDNDYIDDPELGRVRHLEAVVAACSKIYDMAATCAAHNEFPIFLGGDHSIALGTVGGISAAETTGVIWVDAHPDMNVPKTSPSGNLHGMPLAHLLGLGHPDLINLGRPGAKVKPEHVVMVGVRDVDAGERKFLRDLGMRVYTMRDIDERGMAKIGYEILSYMKNLSRVHVSFDMDSLDPNIAPGVGTPVRGGLTYREAHLLMEMMAEWGKVTSLDVVEINPILDNQNQTAREAVDLITSIMGKSII